MDWNWNWFGQRYQSSLVHRPFRAMPSLPRDLDVVIGCICMWKTGREDVINAIRMLLGLLPEEIWHLSLCIARSFPFSTGSWRRIAQLVEPRTGISIVGYEIPSGSEIFGSSLSLLLKWHSLANWDDPVNLVSHSTFQHVIFEVIVRLLKVWKHTIIWRYFKK